MIFTIRPVKSLFLSGIFSIAVCIAIGLATKASHVLARAIFPDLPENYWAERAIAEAYETGFMQTTEDNSFSPNLPISKVDAIVALTNGLEMSYAERPNQIATSFIAKQSQVTKNRLAFPLASTAIMNPGISLASTAILAPLGRVTRQLDRALAVSASATVREHYEDADLIPQEAIDNIAVATQQGMIVNYPQAKYLEPNQPLERGEATALVHQALVSIGKLPPLARTTEAFNYIVSPIRRLNLSNRLYSSVRIKKICLIVDKMFF